METRPQTTIQLGELIVAIYDEAGRFGGDRKEISLLATRAVKHLVRCSRISRELERAAWFRRTRIMRIRLLHDQVLAKCSKAPGEASVDALDDCGNDSSRPVWALPNERALADWEGEGGRSN